MTNQYLLLFRFRIKHIASELEIRFICRKKHEHKDKSQHATYSQTKAALTLFNSNNSFCFCLYYEVVTIVPPFLATQVTAVSPVL